MVKGCKKEIKKLIYLVTVTLLILINPLCLWSQERIEKEKISEAHEEFGKIDYINRIFDENDQLLRLELYFTEQFQEQQGRVFQAQYYDANSNVIKYSSNFTSNYLEEWGISGVHEYYNDNELDALEYTFWNGKTFRFEGAHLKRIQHHSPRLHASLYNLTREVQDNDKDLILTLGERLSSCVKVMKFGTTDVKPEEIEKIQEWFTMNQIQFDANNFSNCIYVNEKGKVLKFIVLKDQLNAIMQRDEIVIYSTFIGIYDNKLLSFVTGFCDNIVE